MGAVELTPRELAAVADSLPDTDRWKMVGDTITDKERGAPRCLLLAAFRSHLYSSNADVICALAARRLAVRLLAETDPVGFDRLAGP